MPYDGLYTEPYSNAMMNSLSARPRGRPRDPEKDQMILNAATALFMERGFEASSMEAIAERAGVSKMTLYTRFKDKDALFAASVRAKCESFVGDELFVAHEEEGLTQGLVRIAESFVALVTDPGAVSVLGLINRESARAPQLPELFFEAAVLRMQRHMQAYLAAQVAMGRLALAAGDAPAACWRFLGAVKGEAHLRALLTLPPPAPEDLSAHVSACVADFVRLHGTHDRGKT